MKQTLKNQSGFTLIELLISVFILLMLSTVVISNFRVSERQKRLTAAKDTVLNAIRNAQNYTLTSRQISTTTCAPGGVTDKSPLDYRVLLSDSSNSVILYAEDKCSTLTQIESYTLPSGTRFSSPGFSVLSSGTTTARNIIQIKFDTPFAPTTVAPASGVSASFTSFQTTTINITDNDGSGSRTVVVDGISGRIE